MGDSAIVWVEEGGWLLVLALWGSLTDRLLECAARTAHGLGLAGVRVWESGGLGPGVLGTREPRVGALPMILLLASAETLEWTSIPRAVWV